MKVYGLSKYKLCCMIWFQALICIGLYNIVTWSHHILILYFMRFENRFQSPSFNNPCPLSRYRQYSWYPSSSSISAAVCLASDIAFAIVSLFPLSTAVYKACICAASKFISESANSTIKSASCLSVVLWYLWWVVLCPVGDLEKCKVI